MVRLTTARGAMGVMRTSMVRGVTAREPEAARRTKAVGQTVVVGRISVVWRTMAVHCACSCGTERVEQQGPDMHSHDNDEKKGIGERKMFNIASKRCKMIYMS